MAIKYFMAPDIKIIVNKIIDGLKLSHIPPKSVYCVRSIGSKSRRIIARIHGLGKIWQKTLYLSPTYIIEVISERFDRLSAVEKEKTLIHELLHIPKGFSGGFRPHKGYIDRETIEHLYHKLQKQHTNSLQTV